MEYIVRNHEGKFLSCYGMGKFTFIDSLEFAYIFDDKETAARYARLYESEAIEKMAVQDIFDMGLKAKLDFFADDKFAESEAFTEIVNKLSASITLYLTTSEHDELAADMLKASEIEQLHTILEICVNEYNGINSARFAV